MADRPSETRELFSEVMTKLLAAAGRHDDGEADLDDGLAIDTDGSTKAGVSLDTPPPLPSEWTIDDRDPKRDGRIAWLIAEVGGARALSHRYEDVRRRRWGRWRGTGYRTVQIAALQSDADGKLVDEDQTLSRLADASFPLRSDPEEPRQLDDMRQAWIGLLACAETQFQPDDDVSALLGLLAHDPDVQAGFGSEWPVGQIVNALNATRPAQAWNDHRIENAKKRLRNWIGRLKRDQGLDMTDLLALFVRCGRERERGLRAGGGTAIASSGSPRRAASAGDV